MLTDVRWLLGRPLLKARNLMLVPLARLNEQELTLTRPRRADRDCGPPGWGFVLGLSCMWAINPVLLAVILLVISRPRPVQNLAVCWVGCLITNVPALL